MKWLKNGNLAKLVAFFMIALIITCTVSFAANGWQSFTDEPDSNDVTNNDKVDENTDGNKKDEDDTEVSVPIQKYYHSITGLECDLEASLKKPLCTVFNSADPMYGISTSYLTIEIPIESGGTRMLCFNDDVKSIGKLGSIAPIRGYMSNVASSFGGILLCYGNDDSFEYNSTQISSMLDFQAITGYCYTEYNSFIYTNGDLVNAFLNNTKLNMLTNDSTRIPYVLNDIDAETITGPENAKSISIVYSDSNTTDFTYSRADNRYILGKNGTTKKDLLNDKTMSFDNVFILYANSTTYETETSTQMILNTTDGGKGKYIHGGTAMEITWSKNVSGDLVFLDENGDILTVNRGTSYIAFAKSSASSLIKIY